MMPAFLHHPSGPSRLALDEYGDHLELLDQRHLVETVKTTASELAGPYKDQGVALQIPTTCGSVIHLLYRCRPVAHAHRVSRNGD